MPRLEVYLPDDLYKAVKERGLPASELLRGPCELNCVAGSFSTRRIGT
ncbi:MAG: hypothetical protein J2P58_07035 [Acidimicrobiaceae bacterium]|nr:hypothetical protein [Acidimicrobiaceae bacterium]